MCTDVIVFKLHNQIHMRCRLRQLIKNKSTVFFLSSLNQDLKGKATAFVNKVGCYGHAILKELCVLRKEILISYFIPDN